MSDRDAEGIDLADLAWFRHGIPHGVFARLRSSAPVYRNPGRDASWSLTRHEDVCAVNRDARCFSSELRGVMMFDQSMLEAPADARPAVDPPRMMIEIDPPRHTRYRRLVNRGFTPRMVAALEPRMREIARAAVGEAVARGAFDFAEELANRLPVQMICELVGVPPGDQRYVERLSDRIQAGAAQGATGAGIALAEIAELCDYANRLGEEKRRELARGREPDDIATTLLSADVDGQALSPSEFGLFFLLLAVAGNETTRSALSGGALAFAEHPEQWARLRARPELLGSAVEEILRFSTPILYMARTATRDLELRGEKLREGERVVLWYASANFDEAVFDEPLRFDVARAPNEHVAFGAGGPHFCLGASLARLELRVMLDELLARVAELRLAGPVVYAGSNFSNGILSLPLEVASA
jgi:cholest-4-en-3-one 26-monooxygenase